MHDLVSNIQVIAAALGTLATAWAVFHKSNREDYTKIIDEVSSEKDEYKSERDKYKSELDEYKDKYYAEHEQRLKLEQENERLKGH